MGRMNVLFALCASFEVHQVQFLMHSFVRTCHKMCPLVVTEASFDKKRFVALRTRKQPLWIMSLLMCPLIPFDQFSAYITNVAVSHFKKGTF